MTELWEIHPADPLSARAVHTWEQLEALEQSLNAVRREMTERIGALLEQSQFDEAGHRVRELMFVEKFGEEVTRAFEALEV